MSAVVDCGWNLGVVGAERACRHSPAKGPGNKKWPSSSRGIVTTRAAWVTTWRRFRERRDSSGLGYCSSPQPWSLCGSMGRTGRPAFHQSDGLRRSARWPERRSFRRLFDIPDARRQDPPLQKSQTGSAGGMDLRRGRQSQHVSVRLLWPAVRAASCHSAGNKDIAVTRSGSWSKSWERFWPAMTQRKDRPGNGVAFHRLRSHALRAEGNVRAEQPRQIGRLHRSRVPRAA